MPKISVVMSVYNSSRFIRESVNSVLNQTFTDFEFIIIDDGSTDGTKKILESYKDNRIRYISKDSNRGSVPCLREAIDFVVSDYIAIQDGDDISMSNRLESQYNFMSSNKDIFCVGGRAIKIDQEGNFIGDWSFPPESHKEIISMLIQQKKSPIINPTSMFRTLDYKQIGGYSLDKSVVASYDLDLWTKALLAGKRFANLKEYLVKYRIHADSMTQRLKHEQISAYLKIMKDFLRRSKDVKV